MDAMLNTPSGRIVLGPTVVRIGSDPGNELFLDDALVAPVHAEITPGENGYQLTDLGSPRGTLINGQTLFPHTPRQLQNGDSIFIGNASLTYETTLNAANASALFATNTDAEIVEQTTDATLSGQLISAATPLQPDDTAKPTLPALTELPTEIVLAVPSEASTGIVSAPTNSAPAGGSQVYAASLPAEAPVPADPIPVAQPMQSFPQANPAQASMPAGAIGYAGTPAFPSATTGMLSQPGYPSVYAQGGYPPFPGQIMPQTVASAPVAKKRGRLVVWALLIIVVLLLLGSSNAVTYALSHPPTPKAVVHHAPVQLQPNGTLQSYCQGIMTGNAEEIYKLLSAQAKIHTSLDDIQKTFDQFKLLNSSSSTMSAQYTNCTFDNIHVSNSLAVATVSLTISITLQTDIQNKKQSQTMTETAPSLTSLVWENNQWKIDFSQFAQPQPALNLSGFSVSTVTP